MAIARIVLAIQLFLLCSYHSGRSLEVSLWRQGNALLGIQTNRLLRENVMNDQVDQVESPPNLGTETKRGIEKTSNLQLKSGEDEGSSSSEKSPNLEGTHKEDAKKGAEVVPNNEQVRDDNSATIDAKQAKEEEKTGPKEEQMKMLNSEGDNTNNGKENQSGEEKKEDSKEGHGKEEKGSEQSEDKGENTPKEGDTGEKKNLESKTGEVEVSEHKQNDDNQKGDKDSKDGGNPKEGSSDKTNEENPEDADDDDDRLHLDNLDDKVPHYSALRKNRIEKGITDTMVLNDIIGENTQSCSVNNGGCADDQICIRIDNIGIKCICKEGHLMGGKCILMNASAFGSFFSAGLSVLLALLWMF